MTALRLPTFLANGYDYRNKSYFYKSKDTVLRIRFNMDDTLHLNRRWIRRTILVFACIYIILSLTHIFCIWFKPKGYEEIVFVLGERYLEQLFMGILFFAIYFTLKYSKPVDVKPMDKE